MHTRPGLQVRSRRICAASVFRLPFFAPLKYHFTNRFDTVYSPFFVPFSMQRKRNETFLSRLLYVLLYIIVSVFCQAMFRIPLLHVHFISACAIVSLTCALTARPGIAPRVCTLVLFIQLSYKVTCIMIFCALQVVGVDWAAPATECESNDEVHTPNTTVSLQF